MLPRCSSRCACCRMNCASASSRRVRREREPSYRCTPDRQRSGREEIGIMKRIIVRATVTSLLAFGSFGVAHAQTVRRVQLNAPPPLPPAVSAEPDFGAPPIPPVPIAPPAIALPPLPPAPPLPPLPFIDVNVDVPWPIDLDFSTLANDLDAVNDSLASLRFQTNPNSKPMPRVQVPRPEPPGSGNSAETLYEQAMSYIDRAQYERAIDRFDQLIQRFDQGGAAAIANRVDGAYYWKAYTQIKPRQLSDALATLEVMQKKFSDSRWLKDAKTLELEARQASGQAVSPDAQADEELKLLALRGIMQSDPDRGVPMIEQLLSGNSSIKVKENALFVLSQSRSARAREIISGIAKGGGNPDLQLRAVRYLGAIGGPENRQILQDVYRSTTDVSIKRAVLRSFVPSGDRERLLAIARSEQNVELRGEAIRQLGAMRATAELSEFYTSETSPELKKAIIQSLFVAGAQDKLMELAKSEKDDQLRRTAIRNLGVMPAARTGESLKALYASEQNADNKREIVNALFVQRNAATLVELARSEKDPTLKKEIVS